MIFFTNGARPPGQLAGRSDIQKPATLKPSSMLTFFHPDPQLKKLFGYAWSNFPGIDPGLN